MKKIFLLFLMLFLVQSLSGCSDTAAEAVTAASEAVSAAEMPWSIQAHRNMTASTVSTGRNAGIFSLLRKTFTSKGVPER